MCGTHDHVDAFPQPLHQLHIVTYVHNYNHLVLQVMHAAIAITVL